MSRVALVRAFLERNFAGHGIGEWSEPGVLYGFRVDAPVPDGRPRYWLAISVEALGDVDFDLVLCDVNMVTYIETQIGAGSGILSAQGGTWDDAKSQPVSRRSERRGTTSSRGPRSEIYVTISRRDPRQDRLVGRAGSGQ